MNPVATYGKLTVFTSLHSHYSIDKSAQVMGLGTDNIVKVPVDEIGRMQVDELGNRVGCLGSFLLFCMYKLIAAK